MPSFFFPCTSLIPDFTGNSVTCGPFKVNRRLWETTIFDLATLETRHSLHLPRSLMELFLNHCHLEIEISASLREDAQKMARVFQVMIYLQDASTFLTPFCTNYSCNSYSGINSRDSELLLQKLPPEMRVGIKSDDSKIEAWSHEPSLWCMPSFGQRKITADLVEAAAQDYEAWIEIERKIGRLSIARLALQTAPIIPNAGSSLLHIWQGIESIFNVSTEVTFRTSILIAQLASNILKPSNTYDLAKKSYGIRSKIAHGGLKAVDQKEWHDAWHLLTLCLKAIITRKNLPSAEDLMKELLDRSSQ